MSRCPAEAAMSLGRFLGRLHAIDHHECPFERWLAVTVPLARLRVEEGMIDEGDLDTAGTLKLSAGRKRHVLVRVV